jgi:hypothetical protein
MRKAQHNLVLPAVFLVVLSLGTAWAQDRRNELGLVMGATIVPAQSFTTGSAVRAELHPSLVLGVEYDRQLILARRAALYWGGDFLAAPHGIKIGNPPPDLIDRYDYLFLTAHLRAKLNPQKAYSPWLLFGGGFARFLEGVPQGNPAFSPGTNTGTLVFGGGIDTRPVVRVLGLPIGFRVEVRDFYSGLPKYDQTNQNHRQHNLAFTGGLLVSF